MYWVSVTVKQAEQWRLCVSGVGQAYLWVVDPIINQIMPLVGNLKSRKRIWRGIKPYNPMSYLIFVGYVQGNKPIVHTNSVIRTPVIMGRLKTKNTHLWVIAPIINTNNLIMGHFSRIFAVSATHKEHIILRRQS